MGLSLVQKNYLSQEQNCLQTTEIANKYTFSMQQIIQNIPLLKRLCTVFVGKTRSLRCKSVTHNQL